MEYNAERKEIVFEEKILNDLDRFVIDFINIIEKYTDYVIVSGYVSILLGRSRATEDVDLLIPEMTLSKFMKMFEALSENNYECINASDPKEAHNMLDEYAIRFFKEIPVPNIEFKKITNSIQEEAYKNRIKVVLRDKILYISSLELQIAYKLSLSYKGDFEKISSDKNFEDAKHLYEIFKEKINKEELTKYIRLFDVEDKWEILKK